MARRYLIPTRDLVQVARGFLMGGADIIPGVSGGTVALILGIYERLVTAISHFDLTLLHQFRNRDWPAAARHLDLRFLVALASGIGLGVAGLATLMHYLLEHHLQHTYAVFFGLILASSAIVARMVGRWSMASIAGLVGGGVFACWLVGLPLLQNPPAGNGYVFMCGVVAICAMILPGISGAFILLILGKYSDMAGLLRGALHGDITPAALATIGVFILGCAVGLICFSKLLRWLLARHEAATMAALCGFMVGSLRKIWPFRIDLTPEVEFKLKQFQPVWPRELDGGVMLSLLLAAAAFAMVIALDWLTKAHAHIPPLAAEDHEPAAEPLETAIGE